MDSSKTPSNQRVTIDWFLVGAVAIACAAAWPLLSGGGLLNTRGGGDSPFLIQRLHQLYSALQDGHFPVRWMADANYGYGYPFFNYYAPLAFYVAAVYKFLGVSYVSAVQLSQLSAFVTAAWATYRLALRWFDAPPAALLTSAAYTLAPFHLVNVYVRGDSIAEFWAMAFYPLVILAVEKGVGDREQGAAAWLGLAYGGLIVSHNISAMIFSPFIVLYAAGRWWTISKSSRPPMGRFIGRMAGGLLLGLLLSAWFWLPAIAEQGLTRLDEVTVGYFNYAYADGYHFRGADLVQRSLRFDPDVADGRAFRMGLLQALLSGLGVAWLLVRRPVAGRSLGWLWVGLAALATLMITPLSLFLWDTLPLLPFTQFPWRFLSVQAFWLAPLIGLLTVDLPGRPQPWLTRGVAAGLSLLLLVAGIGRLTLDFLPVSDEEITPEALARYEWFTGNIGTTVGGEYLAAAVDPRPYTSRWLMTGERWSAVFLEGDGSAELLRESATRQAWQMTVFGSSSAVVMVPTMGWPGWTARVDGQPSDIIYQKGSGLISVVLPPGVHTVELALWRTTVRLVAELLSLTALLGLVGWVVQSGRWRISPAWGWLPPLVVAVFCAVAAWLWAPSSPAAAAPATWDFAQLGFLHRQPSISYGNGAILTGYTIEPETVTAGESVTVTLDWSAVPPGETRALTVALTTPADFFYNFVPPVAAQIQPLVAGPLTYEIPIPADAPAGLYLPQLTLSDANRPRTAAAFKRGTLNLRPVRIVPAPESAAEPAVPTFGLSLLSAERRPDGNVLDLRLAWQIDHPLPNNLFVSYRLVTAAGVPLHNTTFDIQPYYGQRPTVTWPAGQLIYDAVALDLRDVPPASAAQPHRLMAVLYDGSTGAPRLIRRLGTLVVDEGLLQLTPHQPVDTPPAAMTPLPEPAVFLGEDGEPLLALLGYQREQAGDQLQLTLYWRALGTTTADYTHFVHLLDKDSGEILTQHDAQPQQNTLPTSQWQQGEVVADPAVLDGASDKLDGPLRLGFYRQVGEQTINLQTADGSAWIILR